MTKQDNVSAAADTFGEIEVALDALKPLFDRLHRQIGDCVEAGVGKHAEGVRVRNGIEAAKGMVSGTLEKVVSVHAKCTAIAVRENCDVPPALAIDDGMIRPLDGGR